MTIPYKTALLLFIALFSFPAAGMTQKDISGWRFGLNFGFYSPSRYTANYYNGSASNENTVDYVMTNFYRYQEIYQLMQAHDTVLVDGLPEKMHYKPALHPGLYAEYVFNRQYALLVEFNYMKLKTQDAISLEVDPKPYATNPDLRLYPIRGQEERVYFNIGLRRNFQVSDKVFWFVNGGLNVNNTKVLSSSFFVEEKEYDIINRYGNQVWIPNSSMQTYNIYQGGIGFGMFTGGGAMLHFANITLEPGLTVHWLKVNLDGYKSFRPGAGINVRFLFDGGTAEE